MSLFHNLFYTCEEATKLTIKKSEERLSVVQRLKLKIHLLACEICRRFEIQNSWIDAQLAKLANHNNGCLTDKRKQVMNNILEQEIKKSF